jgi:hypothetical protein
MRGSVGVMKKLLNFTVAKEGEARVDKLFERVMWVIVRKNGGNNE